MPWRLTVRAAHRVERLSFDGLDQLIDELEARGRELASSAASSARVLSVKVARFEPAQQVTARLELAGPERLLPSVRAGIDVHGDGSTEAFRGGIRRRALERRAGQDAFSALREALADVLAAAGEAG